MIAIFYINPQGNFLVNDQIDCTHYINRVKFFLMYKKDTGSHDSIFKWVRKIWDPNHWFK